MDTIYRRVTDIHTDRRTRTARRQRPRYAERRAGKKRLELCSPNFCAHDEIEEPWHEIDCRCQMPRSQVMGLEDVWTHDGGERNHSDVSK